MLEDTIILLEKLILEEPFRQSTFGLETLKNAAISKEMKTSLLTEIKELEEYSVTIADRMRTMGNTERDHFAKLIEKRYKFSNPMVIDRLYGYAMYWSR